MVLLLLLLLLLLPSGATRKDAMIRTLRLASLLTDSPPGGKKNRVGKITFILCVPPVFPSPLLPSPYLCKIWQPLSL